MLLEDDLCPSWPALVSWAREAPILQDRGFQRCFYRTEYRPSDGRLVMLVPLTCTARFMIDLTLAAIVLHSSYQLCRGPCKHIWLLVLQDQVVHVNMTTWQRFLNIDVPPKDLCNDTDDVRRIVNADVSEPAQSARAALWNKSESDSGRCIHQHYIQLPATYQGVWIANKPLLQAYINSRWVLSNHT